MAGSRAALRLLFVLLIAAAIAAMHTLGHQSSGGHAHPGPAVAHRTSAAHLPGQIRTAADPASTMVMMGGVGGSLDPSTVCLAILVAVGLAALLTAALVAARRTPPPKRSPHASPALSVRGPPLPMLRGLRLADLSVLRI